MEDFVSSWWHFVVTEYTRQEKFFLLKPNIQPCRNCSLKYCYHKPTASCFFLLTAKLSHSLIHFKTLFTNWALKKKWIKHEFKSSLCLCYFSSAWPAVQAGPVCSPSTIEEGEKDNGAAAPAQHPNHRLRVGMGLNLCCLAHTLIEIPLRAPAVYSEPGWCPL